MSKLNIERLAQLAGIRKLNENGDYDFGGVEPRSQKIPFEPSKSGQADLPVRNVNKQGDNPLEEVGLDGMEGTCEADPQFADMDDDYLTTMINMMRSMPAMSSSEANLQWLAAANAELARRNTFADMTDKAECEAGDQADAVQAVTAIIEPEAAEVSAPMGGVMIDRNGFPEHMEVVQDGRFFVIAKNVATGETETIPRDQWDSYVLDNDSLYDNVPVGTRLPGYDAASDEQDDMVVLGIGEDEDMGDDDSDDLEEGVMDVIRQHVNAETLSKAHSVLQKAGISDVAIANRDVNMTASGYTKLAHILTGESMSDMDAEDYCKHVLHALGDKLDCGETIDESIQLDEFEGMGGDQRFAYTVDTQGNVNITDAMTGASLYLQGQDAQELLGDLSIHGSTPEAVQMILGQYEHVMDNQLDADGNSVDAFGF